MKIKNLSIHKHINTNFRSYALYTLESRGIPNWYDSLTNVQRIAIINAPKSFNKTISLVGDCIKSGYHHGDCLEFNTEVNLADGSKIKIGEWCELYPDTQFLIECVDENGDKQVSIGHSPRIGHITDEMYEIELEDGETIKCTGNHPFLIDGEWIVAKDLVAGMNTTNL